MHQIVVTILCRLRPLFFPKGSAKWAFSGTGKSPCLGKSFYFYKISCVNRLFLGRGAKAPTPTLSALLRKQAVLLRADFVLTEDLKSPYYKTRNKIAQGTTKPLPVYFATKIALRKAILGLSKDEIGP